MKYLQVFTDIKAKVHALCNQLKLKLRKAVGRPLAIDPEDTLTLALYWKRQNIGTKRAVWNDFLNGVCSYKTFVVSLKRFILLILLISRCLMRENQRNAHLVKFTDSTDIPVCLNKNAAHHRTMRGLAAWGRSAKGFYYGLKLHLTVDWNHALQSVAFTAANVDDRTPFLSLNKKLDGLFIADAGYISETLSSLFNTDKRILLAKPRANMKKLATRFQTFLYNQRMRIEWSIRSLKLFRGLISSLPRSIDGYIGNYVYALLAHLIA